MNNSGTRSRRMSDWKPKPALEAFRAVMACPHNQQAARAIAERDTRGIIAAGLREKKAARDEWVATLKPPEPVAVQPPVPVSIEDDYGAIADAVCLRLRVERDDVERDTRAPRKVAARALIAYLMRKHTVWSYPDITAMLRPHSNRVSHSSVVEMVQRVEERLEQPMYAGATETYAQCIAAWDHNGRKFRKVGT